MFCTIFWAIALLFPLLHENMMGSFELGFGFPYFFKNNSLGVCVNAASISPTVMKHFN